MRVRFVIIMILQYYYYCLIVLILVSILYNRQDVDQKCGDRMWTQEPRNVRRSRRFTRSRRRNDVLRRSTRRSDRRRLQLLLSEPRFWLVRFTRIRPRSNASWRRVGPTGPQPTGPQLLLRGPIGPRRRRPTGPNFRRHF